ncbi:MAG: N-acetylglucosamine kinase [Flavobacteriaceae bacterium]|nr:N-acetylglucosamine kinase [Flavobacteriaceae bacterium]
MFFIADSGSTKTDWIAIDNTGKVLLTTQTHGLNASILEEEILDQRIKQNPQLIQLQSQVKKIYFYGAGLGVKTAAQSMEKVLSQIFINSSFLIREDTYAAVYATITPSQPAIICILGTGSNCSYYDGKNVEQRVRSLGYIIMDEASGNFYGKQLIRSYYFNELSKGMKAKFESQYDMRNEVINKNLYENENPNTYLAKVGKFVIENKEEPLFQKIIFEGLNRFIEHQIFQFENCKEVPIHFIGSVAFYLKKEVEKALDSYGLTLGRIVKRPIDRLVEYHKLFLSE